MNMIRTGNILTMDVGENLQDVAAAGLDQAMRIMAGMKPGNEVINVRVFDKSNINQAGNPVQGAKGYGNAYVAGFAKLWNEPTSIFS
jgi:ribose transport system substrate-binding protein